MNMMTHLLSLEHMYDIFVIFLLINIKIGEFNFLNQIYTHGFCLTWHFKVNLVKQKKKSEPYHHRRTASLSNVGSREQLIKLFCPILLDVRTDMNIIWKAGFVFFYWLFLILYCHINNLYVYPTLKLIGWNGFVFCR